MVKLFVRMSLVILSLVAYSWCIDNAVITGTVLDSTNAPVAGIKVTVSLGTADYSDSIKTDINGKYSVVIEGSKFTSVDTTKAEIFVVVNTLGSWQYAWSNCNFPKTAIRADGITDTLKVVDLKVAKAFAITDTLVIKGKVIDANTNVGIGGATVKIGIQKFYLGLMTFDTLKILTDTSASSIGSFALSMLNEFSTKRVSFDALKKKYTNSTPFIDSITLKSADFHDGKKDTLQCIIKLIPPTAITPSVKNIQNTKDASIAFYSIEGRLIQKIENVKNSEFSQAFLSMKSFANRSFFAVWNQNGITHSELITNLK